jgi:pyruvate/2-oxoglutarate/acetoin dehydrogenase E1 component
MSGVEEPKGADVEEMTFAEALCAAQADAMEEDDTIILLGQDIAAGFPFGATRKLVDRFGTERVRNTPISEAATMGCGIGAAMMGMRPVVEVDFGGFALLGFDQLLNNAAKLRYMSGGQLRVPLVVRIGQGPLGSFAAQHTYSLHGWLANTPGLSVCAPATPQDAYDLMRWALRQDDPVVIAEDLRLYRTRGPVERSADTVERPASAVTIRHGTDITIVCYGHGVQLALAAAEDLAAGQVNVEIVDLRLLSPLDLGTVVSSVARTTRAVVVADDAPPFGVASSIAGAIRSECAGMLRAPVAELSAQPVPTPFSAVLERRVFPDRASLEQAVRHVLDWEDARA